MTTLRRRDPARVPPGDVWHWPRSPAWPQAWARGLYGMALVCGACWATGHVADALAGRTSGWWAACSVVLLALWAFVTRPRHAVGVLDDAWCWVPPDPTDAADTAGAPQGFDTPWRNLDGEPAAARIVLDLGPWLLLRTRSGPRAPVADRWVAADQLQGPWRWRFVQGGRHAVGLDASAWQEALGAVRRSWYGAEVTPMNPSDSGFPATRVLERPRAARRRTPR